MATKEKLIALTDITNSKTNKRFPKGAELTGFDADQIKKLKDKNLVTVDGSGDTAA